MSSKSTGKNLKVAALQSAFSTNVKENVEKVTALVTEAAKKGATLILPSELFESHYFCTTQSDEFFSLAHPAKEHPTLLHFQKLAEKLGVVLPVSFFERDGPHYYNSIAIFDADGKDLGIYRKSHIPDGPGYQEKFYFRPGNTGFKTWKTKVGVIGVGICWDQWFPEVARALVLAGAEILLYPTAIGSEPEAPEFDTKDLWQRAMVGHSVSNTVPIIASNRVGTECKQIYYGHSFITDHYGNKIAELGRKEEGVLIGEVDLEAARRARASFGFFRDRRPELYESLVK